MADGLLGFETAGGQFVPTGDDDLPEGWDSGGQVEDAPPSVGSIPGVPASAVEDLRRARLLLRQMTEHLDFVGPLPTPTEWTAEDADSVPGAMWRMSWRFRARYSDVSGRIEIIAGLDDVGDDRPSVYVRGLDIGNDIDSMTPEQARELGRALVAAADMAGSDVIAARCRRERKGSR